MLCPQPPAPPPPPPSLPFPVWIFSGTLAKTLKNLLAICFNSNFVYDINISEVELSLQKSIKLCKMYTY